MEEIIQEALAKGVEMHKAGEFEFASQLYDSVIKLQPSHPDANHNMGLLMVDKGNHLEALPYLETALAADTSTSQFWLSYIKVLINLKRIDDADRVFSLAKENGAEGENFFELGRELNAAPRIKMVGKTHEAKEPKKEQLQPLMSLQSRGHFQQVLGKAENLLDKFPVSFNLYNIQGAAFLGLGFFCDAIKSFKRATLIMPENAAAHYNLGVAFQKVGNFEDAMQKYQQALKLRPKYAEVYNNMGTILAKLGKVEQAEVSFKAALNSNPSNVDYFLSLNFLRVQLLADNFSKPNLSNYKDHRLIKLLFQHPEYQMQMSIANFMLGKFQLSSDYLQNYDRVLQTNPLHTFKPQTKVFCDGYFNFLNALLKK